MGKLYAEILRKLMSVEFTGSIFSPFYLYLELPSLPYGPEGGQVNKND